MGTNFKLPYLKTPAFTYGAQCTCLKPMTPAADFATYLAFLVGKRAELPPPLIVVELNVQELLTKHADC